MDEIDTKKITKDAIMNYIMEYGMVSARCQMYKIGGENCDECLRAFMRSCETKYELYDTLEKIIGNLLEDS